MALPGNGNAKWAGIVMALLIPLASALVVAGRVTAEVKGLRDDVSAMRSEVTVIRIQTTDTQIAVTGLTASLTERIASADKEHVGYDRRLDRLEDAR